MDYENSEKPKRLADMIEKVIVEGKLSRQEQNEIVRRAHLRDVNREDGAAINKLTELIGKGQVQVH